MVWVWNFAFCYPLIRDDDWRRNLFICWKSFPRDVRNIEKMMPQIKFFCQRDLLMKVYYHFTLKIVFFLSILILENKLFSKIKQLFRCFAM